MVRWPHGVHDFPQVRSELGYLLVGWGPECSFQTSSARTVHLQCGCRVNLVFTLGLDLL